LIDELFNAFSSIREIIYKDIQAKYNYLDVDSIERNFVDLIQKDTTIEAILYYRVERALFLTSPDHEFLPFLANLMRIKTCMDLYYSTEIGPGLNIQHGFGIVIGPRHKIGSNFTIHQGVTLGQKKLYSPNESIEIGDHVTLFAGARILGNIAIGDYVQVGANSVLIHNAEAKSVYAGIPAKKVRTLDI
jgi:serine O-acetyltransferase